MVRWLFVSIALLGLSATLALVGRSQNFDSIKPTLIAANITVAVLAINFALSAYQASEYRQFQRGLSPNLLFACLFVLLGAMSPTVCLVFAPALVGIVGISMLPITALLSVALVGLAKREATPNALVKQHSRKRKWRQTFRHYGALCKEAEARWKQLGLAEPENMPMYEWSWTPLPPLLATDPMNMLGAIGCAAAKGGNASGVVQVTEALLAAMDECSGEIYARRVPAKVSSIVETQLNRIAVAAEEADSTGTISARFLDACAE